VALALLLIGIYAALRIFPTGFAYQEFSQNRVRANNLARAELERVKLAGGSLPDAIIVTDPYGEFRGRDYFMNVLGIYDPYDQTPRMQGMLGELITNPGWEPDGAYLQRLIIGETVTIPRLGEEGRGLVPIHLLNFAPIDYLYYDDRGNPIDNPIQVRSTLYQSVNDLNLLANLPEGSHHYYLDYSAAQIYFRVGTEQRQVAIDYTYIGTDGQAHDVLLEKPIVVPTTPAPGRLWTEPIALPVPADWPTISRVVRGTVEVYEVLGFVGFVALGGPPPELRAGEFALEELHDGNGNYVGVAGKIYFSPLDGGRTVKIDYRVRDWGIVREDRRVEVIDPRERVGKVALAVPFIMNAESTSQPDRRIPVTMGPSGPVYVVAVGLSDGTVYYPDDPNGFTVDTRKGELKFNTAPSGTEVRIFYRTDNHWTVQVMKPAAVFRRHAVSGGDAWPSFQSFLWGRLNRGRERDLFFSPEYAGMMVTVDYQRSDGRWIVGELHQLTPVSTQGERIGPPPLGDSFITVRGASVRVRTLWAERGRVYAEKPLVGSAPPEATRYRLPEVWRAVNLDTHLTKMADWGAMP